MNFHSRLLILAVTLFLMPGKPGLSGTDMAGSGTSSNANTATAIMAGLKTALSETSHSGTSLSESAISALVISETALPKNALSATIDPRTGKIVAKCYGKDPCNACSNCSQCQFCNAGGTCGKCIKKAPQKQGAYSNSIRTQSQTESQQRPQPAASGQCKAITKKGTQCSRRATSGKFCYQHG